MAHVRPFTQADISEVVRLRGKCFAHTAHGSIMEQEAYFLETFFRNPWRKDYVPSLVCEAENGAIIGFLGSIVRPIRYRKNDLWMAIPTQLMADPEYRGVCGFQLLRTFLAGPQDLSFADAANSSVKEMWSVLGGATASLQSLTWTRPLRPSRLLLRDFGSSPVLAVLAKAAQPIFSAIDSSLVRSERNPFHQTRPDLEEQELDVAGLLECYQELDARFSVSPLYESRSVEWLFQQLEAISGGRDLRRLVLRDVEGQLVGWYLYFSVPGGIAQTVQVGCHSNESSLVFRHLYYDAWKRGSIAVSGRLQSEYLSTVAQAPGKLTRLGPWTLVHSKDPELQRQVLDGNAWLTRMEGEWWMNF
jgi:hypothetical protein